METTIKHAKDKGEDFVKENDFLTKAINLIGFGVCMVIVLFGGAFIVFAVVLN